MTRARRYGVRDYRQTRSYLAIEPALRRAGFVALRPPGVVQAPGRHRRVPLRPGASFLLVVHSVRIGKTGIAWQPWFRIAPNAYLSECSHDAYSSRGDGAFGHRRSPVDCPGCARVRGLCLDCSPLDDAFQGRGTRWHAGPIFASEGDPDPDRTAAGGAHHHASPPAAQAGGTLQS